MFDSLIVQPIFNLLLAIYALIPGGDFGISLIVFTVLVRLALWPLVKKQLVQAKAIKKLQPEIARIKKQAKGNRQTESMLMLDAYKKHGINPFRSIGILLIQLPIFIALYRVIQIITTDRERVADYAYSFMENLEPIRAIIANPASFNETLFGFIDLTETPLEPNIYLIIIALIGAGLQYYTTKQTTPTSNDGTRLRDVLAGAADGKEPNQAEVNAIVMRKMIKILPLILLVVMINLPGALVLYITVSNLTAVLQQHYILKQSQDDPAVDSKVAETKKRVKKAVEAEIVKPSKSAKSAKPSKPVKQNSDLKITRITAKDSSSKSKRS